MRVLGVVAEYNPFHNGHKYHIEAAKSALSADGVVAVMSGNYVQRGEPALFDKFTRARYALLGGADLVIELPAYFSLKSAEGFARGGVALLEATGIVDAISFGSECGDIKKLRQAARILADEPPEFKKTLAQKLQNGASFASARESAIKEINPALADVVRHPNNILGVEYLKALEGSRITPHTIKRRGEYHSKSSDVEFASATAVREALASGGDVSRHLPYIPDSTAGCDLSDFEQIILYSLTVSKAAPPDSGDGLWERIQKADKSSLDALLQGAKTRRHTMSRIKRALLNQAIDNHLPENLLPSYIRVLGIGKQGATLLNMMKDKATLPVIIKPSKYRINDGIWHLESRATDIYSLVTGRKQGENLTTSPVLIQ